MEWSLLTKPLKEVKWWKMRFSYYGHALNLWRRVSPCFSITGPLISQQLFVIRKGQLQGKCTICVLSLDGKIVTASLFNSTWFIANSCGHMHGRPFAHVLKARYFCVKRCLTCIYFSLVHLNIWIVMDKETTCNILS